MKAIPIGSAAIVAATCALPAQDLISVNLWSQGKPPEPTPWNDPNNLATLTLEGGETAGVWVTDVWENVDFGNPFSNGTFGPLALAGTGGATATLQVNDRRNSAPWGWDAVRDDSDAADVGNATLLDGHLNGTEVDGNGSNPFPTAISDVEIQDIPFALYDVAVYVGANAGQYGDGAANIRVNDQIPPDPLSTDQGGAVGFTLLPGEPDGTLDEIAGAGDIGNYIVFSGLTEPTFRVQVWGVGFNHIGVAGVQVRENTQVAGPVDEDLSTVEASPTQVPADGSATSTITVTLRDESGLPVEARSVSLANTAGPGAATISPATPQTTAANGSATFTVTSSTAGVEEFTATDVTEADLVITQSATVEFLQTGTVDADASTVVASPNAVPADGVSTSTITVTLIDGAGLPVAGHSVALSNSAGPGMAAIDPTTTVTTDADGRATFDVSSDTPGEETFTATDVTSGNLVITETVDVRFLPPATRDLFSVNFWSQGKPPEPTVWNDPANRATLTLENGESAGLWETTAWDNIDFGNPFSNNGFGPVTINEPGGGTATLEVFDRRNSGPWNWNLVRDDSDAVNVGNATLLDGHTNGTEVDNNGANPFPEAITDFEIRDIPFGRYDIAIYIGANSGQFFTGSAKVRVNADIPPDPLDQGGATSFTLLAGEPDGTLDEIIGEGDTGNYIVFSDLIEPTFRAQVWGDGFNHIGVAGFQVMGTGSPTRFAITAIEYSPETGEVTLTWTSRPGATYAIKYSPDLVNWEADLDDGIDGSEGATTTATFDLGGIATDGQLFFRVEEAPR